MEVECSITNKDIMYAYEQLKVGRKAKLRESLTDSAKSQEDNKSNVEKPKTGYEPWHYDFKNVSWCNIEEISNIGVRDSFNINMRRMSLKSDKSVCPDIPCPFFFETEGECLDLPLNEKSSTVKPVQRHSIIKEDISFKQHGLITQVR